MQRLEREEIKHNQGSEEVSAVLPIVPEPILMDLDRLAEYLESEPERQAARAKAQKAKLEALEKKLGLNNGEGASTSASAPFTTENIVEHVIAGKKHKFDDHEYFDQTKELSENAKSAVASGFLKKRKNKKQKLSPSPTEEAQVAEKAEEKKELALPPIVNVVALDAIGA